MPNDSLASALGKENKLLILGTLGIHGGQVNRSDKREKLVLKAKLHEAVRFICEQETGVVVLPDELVYKKSVFMDKTVTEVLAGKHTHKKKTWVLR